MGRPSLPIGERGEINTRLETAPGETPEKWRAYCLYRYTNGRTRQIERWGASENKARNRLKKAIADLQGDSGPTLNGGSRFKHAADIYRARYTRRRRGTSIDTTMGWLANWVLPALGDLHLRECTAARITAFLESLETTASSRGKPLSANSRRSIRSVVSGVLQVAILHGVITKNPCEDLEDIEDPDSKRAVAYSSTQVAAFLRCIDADKRAADTGMALLIRFLFFSGARIGEALAIRWCDINLTSEPVKIVDKVAGEKTLPPHSLWINGNIVRVKGQGLLRHAGKTFRSQRVLPMAAALHLLLLLHKPTVHGPVEPVFPSGTGTWRCPNNTQTALRRLRSRVADAHPEFAEFAGFTFHVGRKSAGTALKNAGHSDLAVADYLGKASVQDVQNTYFGRGMENPAAATALDDFLRPEAATSPRTEPASPPDQ